MFAIVKASVSDTTIRCHFRSLRFAPDTHSIDEHPEDQKLGDVRGLGAMIAFEVIQDRQTKRPAPDLICRLVREAQARGLILLSCGAHASGIRLLPLTIGWDTLQHRLTKPQAAIEFTLNTASKIEKSRIRHLRQCRAPLSANELDSLMIAKIYPLSARWGHPTAAAGYSLGR